MKLCLCFASTNQPLWYCLCRWNTQVTQYEMFTKYVTSEHNEYFYCTRTVTGFYTKCEYCVTETLYSNCNGLLWKQQVVEKKHYIKYV